MSNSIFDSTFNGMGCGEMYRAAVLPDLYPQQKPWRLENWPADELEYSCGIYTEESKALIRAEALAKAA